MIARSDDQRVGQVVGEHQGLLEIRGLRLHPTKAIQSGVEQLLDQRRQAIGRRVLELDDHSEARCA